MKTLLSGGQYKIKFQQITKTCFAFLLTTKKIVIFYGDKQIYDISSFF